MEEASPKIRVPGNIRNASIDWNSEEFKEYLNCLKKRSESCYTLIGISSILCGLATPITNKRYVIWKRFGVTLGSLFVGGIMCNMHSLASCSAILESIMKTQGQTPQAPEVSDKADNADVEFPHASPEMPPSNFTLDQDFKSDSLDYGRRETVPMDPPRPITYEELRMRNREQYKSRSFLDKPKRQEAPAKSEEIEDKWDPLSTDFPRRTNKYGDVIE